MKKTVLVVIMLIVLILIAMSAGEVEASEIRDGEPIQFSVGYCITPALNTTLDERDSEPIWGGVYFSVISNVQAGSIANITLTGYKDWHYYDFGLPKIGDNLFVITEDFEFAWAEKPFQFMDEPEVFTVIIHGIVRQIAIPSAQQAWLMFEEGDVNPCTDPWPSNYNKVFLPLVTN